MCQHCVSDTTALAETDPDSVTDPELERIENEIWTDAKYWCRQARDVADAGTTRDLAVAAKLADTGLKFKRLALELREQRKNREHDQSLLKHDRELSGIRGKN